jgi:hypothetical protein
VRPEAQFTHVVISIDMVKFYASEGLGVALDVYIEKKGCYEQVCSQRRKNRELEVYPSIAVSCAFYTFNRVDFA